MKVYELMSALADLPGGADVICSATLTVNELRDGIDFGEADNGDTLYNICKPLVDVEDVDGNNRVCLNI